MNIAEQKAAPVAADTEQMFILLDKAASLMTEACFSEDGIDSDQALDCVAAIRGQFSDIGRTTIEHDYDRLMELISKAGGVQEDDEFSPTDVLKELSSRPKTADEDAAVINKLSTLLANITLTLKGDELLVKENFNSNDLLCLAHAKMLEIDLLNMQVAELSEKLAQQPGLHVTSFQREKARDAVAEAIGGQAFDCGRAWSAWTYRTMSEDDFSLIAEDSERVAEITEAAITALIEPAPAKEQAA